MEGERERQVVVVEDLGFGFTRTTRLRKDDPIKTGPRGTVTIKVIDNQTEESDDNE